MFRQVGWRFLVMKIAQILKLIRPCNLTLVVFCLCPVGVFFMQYGSSYKDKSDSHSQSHLSLLSHMSSAPLPEFQLKKIFKLLNCFCCSFWPLCSLLHILHQAFAKLKVLWSGRTSHLIMPMSHVYPISLRIYPSLALSMRLYWN